MFEQRLLDHLAMVGANTTPSVGVFGITVFAITVFGIVGRHR